MAGVIECSKSELDLFSEPPLQTSILGTTEVAYKPINALGDDPSVIEFVCLGHGDTYRDLSSIYLRIKLRVMKEKPSTAHTEAGKGNVVNNLLHSLFRQVSVYLNGVPISQSNMDYGYRAYFENLLNYGTDATSTHLESIGWTLDEGKLDSILVADNKGLSARNERTKNSQTVELYGRLHADMFNQHRLLLNNIDLRVSLSVEKPEFYLMEAVPDTSFVTFDSVTMYMNHIQINPDMMLKNELTLARTPATYPYKRVEVKAYTVPPDSSSLSLDNVVIGQLPNLILFAMVDNEAYAGKRNLNPFNFKHNKISQYHLLVNGVQIPNEPYEFDYSKSDNPISTRAYQSLFKDTGIHYFDRGHQISKKFFDNGCFIIATDLTADRSTDAGVCGNLHNQGTVRIEARFREPLLKTTTCLVYCEYDSSIKIDKDRNVYTQF